MKPNTSNVIAGNILLTIIVTILFCVLATLSFGAPQTNAQSAAPSRPVQKAFATPQQAADALILAADPFDLPALKEILGPGGEDLVSSADPVRDKNIAAAFAAKAREKNQVNSGSGEPNRAILVVGKDNWPLPIPLINKGGKWFFDTNAGREEILHRRIGSNELDAIQICRGYVEAQKQYAMAKHDDVNQYAQRIISTPGKQDGLAWRNPDGSWGGPIGEKIAKAIEQGYTNRTQPYHGYYFKILKGQGPSAPLGRLDFVINGVMIGGFALVAGPAGYHVTGVKTFIVSYSGIVYEKDLGPDTLGTFNRMELYDPDESWHQTDDNW
jgi:hypothetical protein